MRIPRFESELFDHGLIQVENGQLEYTIGKDEIHILEATVLHHAKPLGKVEFNVAFYK